MSSDWCSENVLITGQFAAVAIQDRQQKIRSILKSQRVTTVMIFVLRTPVGRRPVDRNKDSYHLKLKSHKQNVSVFLHEFR